MLNKKESQIILQKALETGADFSELFMERSVSNVIELTKGKVTKASTNVIYGIGIRILKGTEEVYGYTNKMSQDDALSLAARLSQSFTGSPIILDVTLNDLKPYSNHPIIRWPSTIKNDEKITYLHQVNEGAQNYSDEISQVICTIVDKEQNVRIANSNGVFVEDKRVNIRLSGNAVAKKDDIMQTASDSIGRNQGYEMFDGVDIISLGKKIAQSAVTMLHADEMKGGKMTVVVHNAFGGVLLHEACVHSLEATSVAKGVSVFSNKLGEKIANEVVTAVDDGTRLNAWGSLSIDDEGQPTQRNVLIENGILKSYLVDFRNARIMKHPTTGSGRRQSYKFSPTSRMTNTFFTPGKSTFEEIIESVKFGFFAKAMGGGSVDPTTGQFNFAVNEGYLIEDGKITKPVRGATLIGSGQEVLQNVDMIANNLDFGHGMCGSRSGSIPTDVGQPTIRVQNMTVGGRG